MSHKLRLKFGYLGNCTILFKSLKFIRETQILKVYRIEICKSTES